MNSAMIRYGSRKQVTDDLGVAEFCVLHTNSPRSFPPKNSTVEHHYFLVGLPGVSHFATFMYMHRLANPAYFRVSRPN
jgi:hypothetical protein